MLLSELQPSSSLMRKLEWKVPFRCYNEDSLRNESMEQQSFIRMWLEIKV